MEWGMGKERNGRCARVEHHSAFSHKHLNVGENEAHLCSYGFRTKPYFHANDSVLSLLPELGTMGSKRGSWGDPLLYQLACVAT